MKWLNMIVTLAYVMLFIDCVTKVEAQCTAATRPQDLTGDGTLTSPNYPNNYPNSSDCQWRITSSGQVVSVTFDFYYTEPCCDYVNIYDGNSLTSTILARLYGNVSTPVTYTSTQQYMYIRFTSDSTLAFRGFSATYSSSGGGGGGGSSPAQSTTTTAAVGDTSTTPVPVPGDPCSSATQPAELTGATGTFSSPGFPDNYYNNADCQWRITSPYTVGIIQLDFIFLNTESCCDLIYLYDGDSTKAPLIASVSGSPSTPPTGYASTQRVMYVRFASDASDTFGGFSATYTSTRPEDPCSPDLRPLDLTGVSGSFSSINYPSNYDNDADCQWRITAVGANGQVRVEFNFFDTESCCDLVYLYDGDSTKATLIATLSGTPSIPQTYESSQRYLYIRFSTDSSTTSRGFSASYSSVSGPVNPCSDSRPLELTGLTGTFTSINYPGSYPNSADCQWKIFSAGVGTVVDLIFNDFSTESCCDLLYIYDGDSTKSQLLATLSGSPSLSTSFSSSQRYMYIRFVSDPVDTDRGFNATFTTVDAPITVCGSVLRVAPNDTTSVAGWGPMCYINGNDAAYVNTPCRDLIQRLPPDIGDYSTLLARGGNFGCHPLTNDGFAGAETACFANYQHTLTLASVVSATKLIVCIRLPTTKN